jgi:hypothetical protein
MRLPPPLRAGKSHHWIFSPIATKRAPRAILKAADYCVSDPEGAARQMVERLCRSI